MLGDQTSPGQSDREPSRGQRGGGTLFVWLFVVIEAVCILAVVIWKLMH